VVDFRDEIDLNGFKLTIDLRRGTDPDKLMEKLFKLTPLDDSFKCNFNFLIDSTPRQMGIIETLTEWIKFRKVCLSRELTFDLSKNVAVSGSLQDEDNDDYVIVEDRALMLDEIVEELLFLELPSRDLCSEDCLGICFKCGKDLNEGGCSCVTKEIDPRLAALSRFLTDSEDNN
jgi:hypothetical protein